MIGDIILFIVGVAVIWYLVDQAINFIEEK